MYGIQPKLLDISSGDLENKLFLSDKCGFPHYFKVSLIQQQKHFGVSAVVS